MNRRQL